ncbi:general odorant-binding protein 19d [Drosophila tropicalis]|uniref:general odorant-binding protein 19d n=1 Tax=Drosophila tropicalis TaxID=46794 RepID=UPI0035ABC362
MMELEAQKKITLCLSLLCLFALQVKAQTKIKPKTLDVRQPLDLTSLLGGGGRGSQPIWTLMDQNLPQIQQMVDTSKSECLKQLKMPKQQRPLMRETRPTEQEKCLLECVLKKIKIMDGNNKLSLPQVEKLTSLVTNNNKVAIALSCSLAQNCNRLITTKSPCEAAHQINQCISRQLESNRVKLKW